MSNVIQKGTVQLSNSSVREIYEYCSSELAKDKGRSAYFSLFVYAMELLIRPIYNEIMSKWYNERADKDFMEYIRQRDLLILKYADRNNDGTVVYLTENQPKITENIVEFENAMTELDEKNEVVLKKNSDGNAANAELMNEIRTISIFNLDIEHIPDDLPPHMIGYFASSSVKELFV